MLRASQGQSLRGSPSHEGRDSHDGGAWRHGDLAGGRAQELAALSLLQRKCALEERGAPDGWCWQTGSPKTRMSAVRGRRTVAGASLPSLFGRHTQSHLRHLPTAYNSATQLHCSDCGEGRLPSGARWLAGARGPSCPGSKNGLHVTLYSSRRPSSQDSCASPSQNADWPALPSSFFRPRLLQLSSASEWSRIWLEFRSQFRA